MSFKDRKRDDHGHVIGNDEVDGQECKHVNGGSVKQDVFDDDYEEEFNEPDEEYNREMKKAQEENAKKSLDLQDAINLADDDILDEEFGKDTPERKLVGAMKEQPTGEATSDEEWNKRHQEFLERGKSTWNQKLQKGDKITIQDKDGNDIDVYINGFWKNGELVDEDAYEEGKDNHWHDFRAVGIADKDGKPLGSVNAFQIKKHSREQLGKPEDFAKKTAKMPNGKEMSLFDFAHNIVNYLDTDTAAYIIAGKYGVSEADAKAYLESSYNTEGDYKEKLNASNKKQKYRQINGQIYPVDADGKIDRNNKFPDLKSFKDVYGENVEEDK